MRTALAILVANLGVLSPCCHAWGDEPPSFTAMQLPPLPEELSQKSDESVRRAQAGATPSPGTRQPGTARPRPRPSPAQATPSTTTPAAPNPSTSPTATTGPAPPSTAPPSTAPSSTAPSSTAPPSPPGTASASPLLMRLLPLPQQSRNHWRASEKEAISLGEVRSR